MKIDLNTPKYRVGHETLSLRQWIDRVISKGYTVYTEEAHGKFTYGYLHNPSKGDSYCFRRNIEREYIKSRIKPEEDKREKFQPTADIQEDRLIVHLSEADTESHALNVIAEDGLSWFETEGFTRTILDALTHSGFVVHDWQEQDMSVGIYKGWIAFSYPD